MTTKDITMIVMGVATVGLIAWDIVVWKNAVPGDTISEVIRNFSKEYLIIPFALGVLCGHWFWPLE